MVLTFHECDDGVAHLGGGARHRYGSRDPVATAVSTAVAASSWPRWRSRRATDRMVAVGSAFDLPRDVRGGPVDGLEHRGSRAVGFDVAGRREPDSPPVMAPARSVRMSPNRLSVTTTSKRAGSVDEEMDAASTCR
jgi:hypothetical protein